MPAYSDLVGPANLIWFILGLVSGSFVCEVADRLPVHENFITGRSKCDGCGKTLSWYELVPIVSFCLQHGRCRSCGEKISPRYPIIEFINGALYFCVISVYGFSIETVLISLLSSALLGLSLIDEKTHEIPVGFNIFILVLGLIRLFTDLANWPLYVIGFFAVSLPLYLLLLLSKGKAIGGGDIKLMAAAGLLLGWKNALLSFILACILGSVIHLLRMKLSHASRTLALGPYLAAGLYISSLFGPSLISAYLAFLTR
ncbi:MAG: prepilin peptidase [Lachnospiraceae bacterium]|nr:prepilin peptidase [Lachnospiraceae bacterium]